MLHIRVKRDDDVLTHHSVPQLQIGTADHPGASSPFDFEAEEMAEQTEMGEDAKVGFIEIDEASNMQDGVWAQIAKADAIISNQSTKEGMNRNAKATEEVILKHN